MTKNNENLEKMSAGCCPACNSNWEGESILETLLEARRKGSIHFSETTEEELAKLVHDIYGESCKSRREIGIQILGKYDGVSYWKCPDCNTIFDRFTGEIAVNNEKEKQ